MTIKKTSQNIQNLFDEIAQRYDFMNKVISFGLQGKVKEEAVKMTGINPHSKILDACCGTGDIARLIKTKFPSAGVTGLDFSDRMLEIARGKTSGINFVLGDITKTDFPSASFDVVTMSFGLRNIPEPEKALEEIYRVLKPEGEFLHLDFWSKNIFSRIFDIEALVLAGIFCGKTEPYKYLIQSKKDFPPPDKLIKVIEASGFRLKGRKNFVFNALSAQVFEK